MVTGDGVLGQVFRTGPFSSEIILITDAEHALPVQVLRSGVRTIALGTGRSTSLDLPYVPQNYDVKVGDVLVTSGLGQRVSVRLARRRASPKSNAIPASRWREIQAVPLAKIETDREVLFIWGRPNHPAAPASRRGARGGGGQTAGGEAMNLARREPRWAVSFTVLHRADRCRCCRCPTGCRWCGPSFIALVIIYWSIYAPHAGGIFAPWLAGLALDVFKGDVLGQNALAAITLVAYIAMSAAPAPAQPDARAAVAVRVRHAHAQRIHRLGYRRLERSLGRDARGAGSSR